MLDTDSAGGEAALENDDDLVRRLHHYSFEKFGGERWFDKSFSIIVNCAGQVGLNVEHSWAEASVPLSVMSRQAQSHLSSGLATQTSTWPGQHLLISAEDEGEFSRQPEEGTRWSVRIGGLGPRRRAAGQHCRGRENVDRDGV